VLAGAPDAAFAQMSWFQQWFSPAPRQNPYLQQQVPNPQPKRKPVIRKPVVKAPDKPAVTPTYFVAVLGDSLGQLMGQGLVEAFTDRPEVSILQKAKESSGLVRDDFYDWPKTVDALLASDEKVNIAVMLIGSNDHQPLRVGKESYDPGSPKWIELYTQRIAEISKAFHDKNIPLIWVGLPIMKSDKLSADLLTFNDFYREQAEKNGATYIDIWEAFENDHGQFDAFGPDVNGQSVRIRTADGVNFTKAGARKLAHFVESDIRRNLDSLDPKVDPALVTVPSEAPGGGTPGTSSTEAPAGTPAAPVEKPVAGPVLPLTGPVSAPGGALATRDKPTAANLIKPAAATPSPDDKGIKPGRADDFSWSK